MTTSTAGTRTLRVLTWNVRDLLGDPLAVARVVRAADADLVCLQEAPRWPGSRWRMVSLARRCGLLFVDGGRSAAGCALLASLRVDVRWAQAFLLPVEGRVIRPRGAVVAEVAPVGAAPVVLACVHLGLASPERVQHARLLRERLAAAASGGGVLVAGDLNEAPGGPAWQVLAPVAADPLAGAGGAPTFPASGPRRRIDAVLAGGVEVLDYDEWRGDAADVVAGSDHRPVLATFAIPLRE